MAPLFKIFTASYFKNSSQVIYLYVVFMIIIAAFGMLLSGTENGDTASYAVIWINVILINILLSDKLYRDEAEQGMLEQWLLMPVALEWIVATKWFVHWLASAMPMLLLVPVAGLLLHLDSGQWGALMVGLLIGSVTITALCSIAASATLLQSARASVMFLLVIPLMLPAIILGVSSCLYPDQRISTWLLMSGFSLVILPVSIFISTMCLRVSRT